MPGDFGEADSLTNVCNFCRRKEASIGGAAMTKPSRVVEGGQHDFSEVTDPRLFGGPLADAQSMRLPNP